jgi:hypothetical protein
MLQIHPDARTTPAVRAEIAGSDEPSGVLAWRYGVSAETVRKCASGRGRLPRPLRQAAQAALEGHDEGRAVVCALRRATNFALDDLTFVVSHFLPQRNRTASGASSGPRA